MSRFILRPSMIIITLVLLLVMALMASSSTRASAAVTNADLRARAATTILFPAPGTQVLGRAEIHNFGPNTALSASITEDFTGYEFDSFCVSVPATPPAHGNVCNPVASILGCTVGASSFTCDVGDLDVGDRIVISFYATAESPFAPRLRDSVTSLTHDPNPGNNHATANLTLP